MSYKAGSKSFSVQVPTHTEYITEYLGGGGQNSPVRTRHRAVEVADKDYLDVNVDLYVDDAPFNESARDCRNSVTELTGSVAAMNVAQVATIKKSGEKISQTIVGGFYNMVKSEISQQLAEMYSKFEALLARINSISKLVAVQKETMERDYSRISRQYLELFDGLDEALNRRIRSLDAPAFEANAAGKNALAQRFIKSGVAGTLISAEENPAYQIQLEISSLRRRIQEAIAGISTILDQEREYENYMQAIVHGEPAEQKNFTYVPVMGVTADRFDTQETYTEAKIPSDIPFNLRQIMSKRVLEEIDKEEMPLSSEEKEKMDFYFQSETEKWMDGTEEANRNKNNRVAEMINRLWKQDGAN